MTTATDRIEKLLAQNQVTGIDFVHVDETQQILRVHFLRQPSSLAPPLTDDPAVPATVHVFKASDIGSLLEVPLAEVNPVDWDDEVLVIKTKYPGGFSLHKLFLDHPDIDPYFNNIAFSFKANCDSGFDCEVLPHECPPEAPVDFPINYLARDFWSFRRALLDFASLRYPDWKDRLEADAGVMLAEVMSALGDELAYYQDRIAREAYLETATQRRSLRRHARLVDYHLHDGLGASVWLDFTVSIGQAGNIPAATHAWAVGEHGERFDFEVGRGFQDLFHPQDGSVALAHFPVNSACNFFKPHIWSEKDTCLPVGANHLFIRGHHAASLAFDDLPPGKDPGKWVLLKTNHGNPAAPARTHLVRLVKVTEGLDPVIFYPNPNPPPNQINHITRLEWEPAQALPFEMDLTVLEVRGNLVPATAGKTYFARFLTSEAPENSSLSAEQQSIPAEQRQTLKQAVERTGRDGSVAYLFSLDGSDAEPLVWLGENAREAHPEVHLHEISWDSSTGSWNWKTPGWWAWRSALIGASSSQSLDRHFTLDDGTWKRVVGYLSDGSQIEHRDYASDEGFTLRFGDGEFGRMPAEGTIFQATWRLGGGQRSNVAAGSVLSFASPDFQFLQAFAPGLPALPNLDFIDSVAQPLPAAYGLDAETSAEARLLAPDAFRAVSLRAVRAQDYAEAAERLPWVQRAGASFRWTGSWLTAFVTPDPLGAVSLSEENRLDLVRQLDRFRQAGREAYVLSPVYADLDLHIFICVETHAYRDQVRKKVLEALLGKGGVRPAPGFFSPDRFTFGSPLERSSLEAHIQSVEGVRAVEQVRFRRRGQFAWRNLPVSGYQPEKNAIVRLANDPSHPERGMLKLEMHGGA